MNGRANNEWNETRGYAYGAPNRVPMNRGTSFISRSFSFGPNSELRRGASGRPRPVVFEEWRVINEPPSSAGYRTPQTLIPPSLYSEYIEARPRSSIRPESPSRFITQLSPPVQPHDNSKLTANEQQTALNRLRKTIHNPSPRRFTRRVSLYYRDHARNTKDLNTQDDEDVKRCAVCLEDFEPKEEVMLTPCDHMFHEECIVPWVTSHGQCPVCRYTLCDRVQSNPSGNDGNGRTTLAGNELLVGEIASIVRALEEVSLQWSRLNH